MPKKRKTNREYYIRHKLKKMGYIFPDNGKIITINRLLQNRFKKKIQIKYLDELKNFGYSLQTNLIWK